MSVDLKYLEREGLTPAELAGLIAEARVVGLNWARAGIDPAVIDLVSELLARTATGLGPDRLDGEQALAAMAFLELGDPVVEWIRRAFGGGRDAEFTAAIAVHLVDVAEALAGQVFVPELPRLFARSDRTGEDARRVGTARHLRG